jgi:hypothetical protein
MTNQNIKQSEIDAFLASGKTIKRAPTVGDCFHSSDLVDLDELFRFSSFASSHRRYRWKKS